MQREIQRCNSYPKRIPTSCPTGAPADLYACEVQPTRVPITAFQVGSCHNEHIQTYLCFKGRPTVRSKSTVKTLAAAGRDLALVGGTPHPGVAADGWDARVKPHQGFRGNVGRHVRRQWAAVAGRLAPPPSNGQCLSAVQCCYRCTCHSHCNQPQIFAGLGLKPWVPKGVLNTI